MWLFSWLDRFGAGRNDIRPKRVRTRPQRGRLAQRLSIERLEDRLAPAAGALDLTFGTGGTVTTDFAASTDTGTALALQTDGKIVVVGATDTGGSGRNFAVARYLADGTLDPNFSPGPLLQQGKVATDFAGGDDGARSVAIQADGKIVVAGFAVVSGSFDFAVARYNPDGILDDSFGTHGKVTTDFASGSDDALGLAIQADGKIVVAGRAGFPLGPSGVAGSGFGLARYNPDGSLDATFNTGGKVATVFAGDDEAHSVVIQADGKIVAAGMAGLENPAVFAPDFALARYSANGVLDDTFGTHGKVTTDFAGGIDEVNSVAIQADGKIIAAGETAVRFSANLDFALARYNRDGSLDSNFDADGKVTTDFGDTSQANSVVIQADAGNRIVVAGTTTAVDNFSEAFALARYNTDGSLDASFGTGGHVATDVVVGSDVANGIAIQADGKIVAAGFAVVSGSFDFAVARYEGVAPEIAVFVGGAGVASGSTIAYGSTLQGTPVSKTFIIRNVGNLNLTVSSISVPAGYQLTTFTLFPIILAPGAATRGLTVQLTATTAGIFSGQVFITNNDSDENPFVINVTGTVLAPAHEIKVLTGTTNIPDNTGVVNFGTFLLVANVTRTFTVQNIGNTNLTLGPSISVSAPFSLASGFGSTTLGPGASTAFAVHLNTSSLGTFSGQVSFATNDSDENPFNFTVTGAVSLTSSAPMIRGESLTRQVDEGGVATLRGHLVDSDPLDELFLRVDWGDGTPPETHAVGRAPFAIEHRYLDDAPSGTAADDFQVHFTWFDSGGGSNSKTLPVTVRNVAPQVSAGLPVHLRAGETLSRVGSFTDPGLDSWYGTVDYGDGRGPQWLALGPEERFTLSHRYTQPGVYHVLVRIFDDDGGVGTATLPVTVLPSAGGEGETARAFAAGPGDASAVAARAGSPADVPPLPRLFLGGAEVVRAGQAMQHAGSFTDAGAADTWTATVDYGDGSGPQRLVIQSGQELLIEHRFTRPGKYRVTVAVLDKDSSLSTDTFLVIVLPAL